MGMGIGGGGYGYGGTYQGGYGQPMRGGFGDMRGGMRGRGFGPINPMMMRGGPRGGHLGPSFNPGMARLVKFINQNCQVSYLFIGPTNKKIQGKIYFTKSDMTPDCRLHRSQRQCLLMNLFDMRIGEYFYPTGVSLFC